MPLNFNSEQDKTQSARAYRAIRSKVLRCELAPGDVVNERALMSELGFGRTPIREALLRLSGERLVLFTPQRIEVAPITFEVLRDLYEDRMHSERLAARLCAQRMDEELAQRLAHCFDTVPELLEQGRTEDVIHLDFTFHSLLYTGSGNGFLTHHLHQLFGHSYRIWFLTDDGDANHYTEIVASHQPLIDALMKRDLERVDSEVEQHIVEAYDRVFKAMRERTFRDQAGLPVRTLADELSSE